MEITYALSKADLVAFRQFHASRKNKLRWLTTLVNTVLVAVWAFQLCTIARVLFLWRELLLREPSFGRFFLLTHQHTLTMFGLYTLLVAYLLWGQKLLSLRRTPADALLARPRTLSLSPGGVRVVSANEDMRRAWADMTGVDSDRERLYLYTTATNAVVVPKRAFGSIPEAQAFEAEARAFLADPRLQNGTGPEPSAGESVWPPPPSCAASRPQHADAPDPLETPVPGTTEVSYVTRPADLWRAQGDAMMRQPAALLPMLGIYTVCVALWTVPRMAVLPALGLSLGIAALVSFLTVVWTTRQAIARRFEKFRDGRPCRTVARPDWLFDITPEGRTALRWPDVVSVTVRGGDVLIRTRAGGLIVPRSAFTGEPERAAFVDALRGFLAAAQETSA